MSTDPRYVVLDAEEYEKLGISVPRGTPLPTPLDYVVVAPPPPPEEGKTDLGVYLACEIAGAHLSSINSGTLGPAEIVEALHHIEGYLGPLKEVSLAHLVRQHSDETGAIIVAAGPNEVLQRWITDNAERLSSYVDDIYAQAHNPGITRRERPRHEEEAYDG